MDVVARLIKLKPDRQQTVTEWATTIMARKDEALATLRNEGVALESWFQVTVEGVEYLLCFMRADSIQKATGTAAESTHAIDVFHRQFKQDAWVKGSAIDARLLVDLVNDSR